MTILDRNCVVDSGPEGKPPLVFVHGYGCDQTMWRRVTPSFERVVTYDLTGMGRSDLSAYDFRKYADLQAHADDLLQIIGALELSDVTLVGHSIGASIAVLAANRAPDRIARTVLVSPTPSFLDHPERGYRGGFSRKDLEGLIDLLEENHLGWSAQMAPTIVGQPAGEFAAVELTQSFCRTGPEIAAHFGRVTFFADCIDDMAGAARPALILHCDDDALVPMQVAEWMQRHVPGATLKVLRATGHCPHMTVPDDVVAAMQEYLRQAA